jgi:hypothetical protein
MAFISNWFTSNPAQPNPVDPVYQPVHRDLTNFNIEPITALMQKHLASSSPNSNSPPPAFTGSASLVDLLGDIRPLMNPDLVSSGHAAHTMGFTTAANSVQGFEAAYKAGQRFMASREINDFRGMVEAFVDGLRGVFQSLGGALYLPYRVMSIFLQVKGISASAVLGQVASGIGMAGSACFVAFGAMMSALGVFLLGEDFYMDAKLNLAWGAKEKPDAEWFERVMQKVLTDSNAKLDKLILKGTLVEKKAQWSEAALDFLTEQVMCAQEAAQNVPAGQVPLSREQVREFLTQLFAQRKGEFDKSAYVKSMNLDLSHENCFDSVLQLIGFKLAEEQRSLRSRAKFSRVTSSGCLEAIEKAANRGLLERLKSTDELTHTRAKLKVAKLKDMVWDATTTNKVIHVAFAINGLLTFTTGLIGLVTAIPGLLVAASGIFMASSAGWGVVDGYFSIQGLSNGTPGTYDKQRIIALACFILIMLAVSTGLTLGYGLPLIPLILALAFGVVGLNLCTVALVQAYRKELQWEKDHPDLTRLRDCLLSKGYDKYQFSNTTHLDEEAAEMFKKLPAKDREAVREIYFNQSKKGQLPFKNKQYADWDTVGDFGGNFIEGVEKEQLQPTDLKLFKLGVKEAVAFAWQQYAVKKTEENKAIALQMERLLAAIKKEDLTATKAALSDIKTNVNALEQLKGELWYVVKRSESARDFYGVVQPLLEKSRTTQKTVPQVSVSSKEEKSKLLQPLVTDIANTLKPIVEDSFSSNDDTDSDTDTQ